MDGVQKFLARYKNLTPPEASKQKCLIDVIREECGISLEERHVMIRGNGAHLACHPTVRGEIRLHTARILAALHEKHNVRLAFIR
jgi:hypothetical protein